MCMHVHMHVGGCENKKETMREEEEIFKGKKQMEEWQCNSCNTIAEGKILWGGK